MGDDIIRVSNSSYAKYEELLIRKDEVKKQAFQYERAYVREFGDLILEVFQLKLESIRKKKTIEYCQVFANRGESVDQNALQAYLPEVYEGAMKLCDSCDTENFAEVLNEVFPQMPSISVDFGVLEKADRLFTIPGSFGWDDVGSWPALRRIAKTDTNGNYRSGDVLTVGTQNCVFVGGKRLIAAVGLEQVIVVDTEDALLVCGMDSAQNVKKITEMLREQGRGELL